MRMTNKDSAVEHYLRHQAWTVGEEPRLTGFPDFPAYCLIYVLGKGYEMGKPYEYVEIASMDEDAAKASGYPTLLPSTFAWSTLAGYSFEEAHKAIADGIDKAFEDAGIEVDSVDQTVTI